MVCVVCFTGEMRTPSYYKLEGSAGTKACLASGFTTINATHVDEEFGDASEASRAPGDDFYSQAAVYASDNDTCPEGDHQLFEFNSCFLSI